MRLLLLIAALLSGCVAPLGIEGVAGAPPRSARRDASQGQDPVAEAVRRAPRPQQARQGPALSPASAAAPRPFRQRWQPFTVTVDGGFGQAGARISGAPLDDRADAWFARLRIDGATGAGIEIDLWRSDRELFLSSFISDGTAPAPATARLQGFDVFPHARIDWQLGPVGVPIRLGVFVDRSELDHAVAGVNRSWLGFGPRAVVEPTWRFAGDQDHGLECFVRCGADAGGAWFQESYAGGQSRDVTSRWAVEAGGGVRGRCGALHAELGVRFHHAVLGELDGDLFGSRSRTELQRQQLFLGAGIRF